MIKDKSMPLYVITIGEFIELTRQTVLAVMSEKGSDAPSTLTDDEHFTIAQCAKFLRCSLVSIHKYKKVGLPYYKIGRKILFKKSEVLAFMKGKGKKLPS
jgi:excisionase family DNA binding protein